MSEAPLVPAQTAARIADGVLGAGFLGSGMSGLIHEVGCGSPVALRVFGCAVALLVGAQALLSAARARRSWLNRLGPLP